MNIAELSKKYLELEGVLTAIQGALVPLGERVEAMDLLLKHAVGEGADLVDRVDSMWADVKDVLEVVPMIQQAVSETAASLDEVRGKVEGRNRSAAVKRNMTDADALEVLTGELKEVPHKDAAERIGLTYAQVYSARLEFTFKHVHKELRESGFVNPWAKK